MSKDARLHTIRILSFTFGLMLATCGFAFAAANSGITYHGRIMRPDGQPMVAGVVEFRLKVLTPGTEACLLYEEKQTIDMRGSSGVFSITLNDSTGQRMDSGSYTLEQIFANRATYNFAPGACASGNSWTPSANDGRRFQVSFRDENMTNFEILPSQALNFVPMAIEAKQVGGYGPLNLLRVDDSASAANSLALNMAQLTEFKALVNGTSTNYFAHFGYRGNPRTGSRVGSFVRREGLDLV